MTCQNVMPKRNESSAKLPDFMANSGSLIDHSGDMLLLPPSFAAAGVDGLGAVNHPSTG